LRRWTPRSPAPAIRARLFGEGIAAAHFPVSTAWTWWVPALACLTLVLAVLNSHNPTPIFQYGRDLSRALDQGGWSNQNVACFAASWQHSEQNAPPILEWTSDGHSSLDVRSFLLLATNNTMR
jgi:hypothetical protein